MQSASTLVTILVDLKSSLNLSMVLKLAIIGIIAKWKHLEATVTHPCNDII